MAWFGMAGKKASVGAGAGCPGQVWRKDGAQIYTTIKATWPWLLGESRVKFHACRSLRYCKIFDDVFNGSS
jgi:hypothetical protein